MKVSVLMPIYRTDERFLREAVESVLAQTFADFEFLILDDSPDDDRARVVAEFSDPRIKYVKNDRNIGISASRNKLLDLAGGEYLAVFDHDDVCRPDRLEKQVAWLDAHPECGVVGGWTRLTSNGSVNTYPEDDRDIRRRMMLKPTVWHPASMIRASVLKEHGIRYEAEYSPVEDYMLWMKLLPHTKFHNLQEVVMDYRWHDANTSQLRKKQLMAADLSVRAWARTNYPGLYAEYEFHRRTVSRVRLFGIPLLKITTKDRETDVRLFGRIPVLSVARKYDV